MNFQTIPPIETADQLLDIAFRGMNEALTAYKTKKLSGTAIENAKVIAKERIKTMSGILIKRTKGILESFPSFDSLPELYQALIKALIDYVALKKALGSLNWALKAHGEMAKKYLINVSKTKDRKRIEALIKEYYGRASSIAKQVKKELVFLAEVRNILRKLPDIKDMPTITLYGFPNVGKTTVLKHLTGANAKISSYPFTTQKINVGYTTIQNMKYQLLDVPGILNREKMNEIEMIADITLELAGEKVIFIIDPTEEYPLEQQERLYKKVKKMRKDVLVYISKADIAEKDMVEGLKKKYNAVSSLPAVTASSFFRLKAKID